MEQQKKREQWGSRIGFILAAGGSAVGLGNVWKFPYIVGQNGGAAFVLAYVLVVVLLGLTVMLAEIALGRSAQLSCISAFRKLKGGSWTWVGVFCVIIPTLILSYYAVIGGWTLKYIFHSFGGLMAEAGAGKAADVFVAFISSPWEVVAYQALFGLLTAAVVLGGVSGGIERVCKIMMPGLFVLLVVMIFRSVTLEGASKGLAYYLNPDFSKLTASAWLAAVGQAFFSLSLGMGIMITYGSYLKKDINLPQSSLYICIIDSAVAFLAGLVVFPAVFAFGFDVEAGPSLTFITLPAVFAKMPFSSLWSAVFFVLFFFAAITSAMSLLEVPVSYLVDRGMKRRSATLLAMIVVFLIGVPSSLGLDGSLPIFGKDFLDALDYLTNSVMMPITAALTCIFVGWFVHKEVMQEVDSDGMFKFPGKGLWMFFVRYAAPVIIAVILVTGLKW